MNCSQCNSLIKTHLQSIIGKLEEFMSLRLKVEETSLRRALVEGFDKDPRVVEQGCSVLSVALDKLIYYQCQRCNDPFFGGMKDCVAMAEA